MDLRTISKAVGGGLAAALSGVGTAAIVIPDGVVMPWWGYLIVGIVNAVLGAAVVYWSPANKTEPK